MTIMRCINHIIIIIIIIIITRPEIIFPAAEHQHPFIAGTKL